MEWKYIQPVENLHELRFLSEICTEEEYKAKCRGPYLVGHIADKKSFTEGLNDYETYLETTEIDKFLGFNTKVFLPMPCDHLFDRKQTIKDGPQRAAAQYHMDNHRLVRTNPFSSFGERLQICRTYVSASSNGTLFLKEEFTVSLDILDYAGIELNHD